MEKTQKKAVTDLTQGVIWKQLLFFALPFLFSNVLQQFYSTADAAIVGRNVGEGALAAIGSCDKLVQMMINLFVGISTGASITVSQVFGQKNYEGVRRSVQSTIALALISGTLLMTIGLLFAPAFLRLMRTPDEIQTMAEAYIRIYFLGMIPMMLFNMGSGIMRAMGNSTSALIYLGFSGIVNVGLDLLFVQGFSWGIEGAAAATTISQLIPAVLVIWKLTTLDKAYALRLTKIRLHRTETDTIIRVGVPAGMRMVLICIANIIVQTRINEFGVATMAGCTLFFKLEGYMYALISAIGLALTSFSGQNYGAEDYERMRKGKQISMVSATVVTFVLGGLLCVFAPVFCGIFTEDPQSIYYGSLQLRYQLPLYIIFSWNEVYNGAVLASGRSMVPMIISLVGMCFARVAFIMCGLALYHDPRMIYLAFPFSWIVTHIGIVWYYYRGKWANGMRFKEALSRQTKRADQAA